MNILGFDRVIVEAFSSLRTSVLDNFFLGITYISSKWIVIGFLTLLFLLTIHRKKWIVPVWLTLAISITIAFLTKVFIARPRPYIEGIVNTLPKLEEVSHTVWNFSFVSSHAIMMFAAIPIINKTFPRFRYVWIGLASLVILSRVYFGLHYLSDVVVGGLVGYIIGLYIVKLESKSKFGERIYKKVFGK